MSIGYDSAVVPDVDLGRRPARRRSSRARSRSTVTRPQAGAAFSGVVMAALANGGSADDIAPGVDFFGELKEAGNFLPVDPTPATIESGQTPVVIDWDYLNAAEAAKLADAGRSSSRRRPSSRGYYFQAINADAPHPAAARLWQEFLYSDEGQNLWLEGGARPVRGRRDGRGRHDRRGAVRRPARRSPARRSSRPTSRPSDGRRLPGRELGQGDRLSTAAPRGSSDGHAGRRFAVGPAVGLAAVPASSSLDLPGRPDARRWWSARSRTSDGGFTLDNLDALGERDRRSPRCGRASLLSSVDGADRRRARRAAGLPGRHRAADQPAAPGASLAVCGVLAQFGGVTLAFALIATLGFGGLLTKALRDTCRASTSTASGWLFELPGPGRSSTPTSRSR